MTTDVGYTIKSYFKQDGPVQREGGRCIIFELQLDFNSSHTYPVSVNVGAGHTILSEVTSCDGIVATVMEKPIRVLNVI